MHLKICKLWLRSQILILKYICHTVTHCSTILQIIPTHNTTNITEITKNLLKSVPRTNLKLVRSSH